MTEAPLVRVQDLEVGYRGRAILPPVTLEVRPREQWALIGQNGAGKSTFLKTLLGLQPAVAGSAAWLGGANAGYVPQRASIDAGVPARVVDIVRGGADQDWSFLHPLAVRRRSNDIERALADSGTTDLARQRYAELSEGQKQRVLVARALASDPELLVLDEPTAAMDLAAERSVFELLAELREKRGLAVLIVSHQLSVAARFATHALVVDKDSRLVRFGTFDDVARDPEVTARYGVMLQRSGA